MMKREREREREPQSQDIKFLQLILVLSIGIILNKICIPFWLQVAVETCTRCFKQIIFLPTKKTAGGKTTEN